MVSLKYRHISTYFLLIRLSVRNKFCNSKKVMKVVDKISTKKFYNFLFWSKTVNKYLIHGDIYVIRASVFMYMH